MHLQSTQVHENALRIWGLCVGIAVETDYDTDGDPDPGPESFSGSSREFLNQLSTAAAERSSGCGFKISSRLFMNVEITPRYSCESIQAHISPSWFRSSIKRDDGVIGKRIGCIIHL
jgi:hypothetical protein